MPGYCLPDPGFALRRETQRGLLPSVLPLKSEEPLMVGKSGVAGKGSVLRLKVGCLRVCEQGPIAAVYPDGSGTTPHPARCWTA